MQLSEKRKGESLIIGEAILGGIFPVVVVLSYATVSPLASLAWSTVLAAGLFAVLIIYRKSWKELTRPLLWKYAFFIALFIGALYYGLYYAALTHTTTGNTALIALVQVFTSFILFNLLLKKERFSFEYVIGALFMLLGAGIVLAPNASSLNIGDLLMLLAICIVPLGNFYQQKARDIASSETILFLRSVLSAPIIFAFVFLFGAQASVADLSASLQFLLINGVIILGFGRILFIEGIHRIPVTKAIALESVMPLVTLITAWLVLAEIPTLMQVISFVPLCIGVLLLTDQIKLRRTTRS